MVTDLFTYTAAVEQLRNCKYNKDLEQLLRKYYGWYSYAKEGPYPKPVVYEHIKYNYKLYTLALALFSAKSKATLPDFLYNSHIYAQRNLTGSLVNRNTEHVYLPLHDYVEFVDMFEFDTIVETQTYNSDYITALHNVVLGNHLHFKFKFNQQLDYFDKYSTNDINDEKLQSHLHALRLKQTLSPDQPATVLDQYVADTYAAIQQHQDISKQIILLRQHTSALQEYQCGQS